MIHLKSMTFLKEKKFFFDWVFKRMFVVILRSAYVLAQRKVLLVFLNHHS